MVELIRTPEKVTCRNCSSDLTNTHRLNGFYGCDVCNSWTLNVDVVRVKLEPICGFVNGPIS